MKTAVLMVCALLFLFGCLSPLEPTPPIPSIQNTPQIVPSVQISPSSEVYPSITPTSIAIYNQNNSDMEFSFSEASLSSEDGLDRIQYVKGDIFADAIISIPCGAKIIDGEYEMNGKTINLGISYMEPAQLVRCMTKMKVKFILHNMEEGLTINFPKLKPTQKLYCESSGGNMTDDGCICKPKKAYLMGRGCVESEIGFDIEPHGNITFIAKALNNSYKLQKNSEIIDKWGIFKIKSDGTREKINLRETNSNKRTSCDQEDPRLRISEDNPEVIISPGCNFAIKDEFVWDIKNCNWKFETCPDGSLIQKQICSHSISPGIYVIRYNFHMGNDANNNTTCKNNAYAEAILDLRNN